MNKMIEKHLNILSGVYFFIFYIVLYIALIIFPPKIFEEFDNKFLVYLCCSLIIAVLVLIITNLFTKFFNYQHYTLMKFVSNVNLIGTHTATLTLIVMIIYCLYMFLFI